MNADVGSMAYRFRMFIDAERDRFDTRENNLFGAAFSDVWAYRWFLDVILGRYAPLGPQFEELHSASQKEFAKSSGGRATNELMLVHARMAQLQLMVRLEIESFYLFAAVLLERVATGLGFYFEARADSDWRHSGMTSSFFEAYSLSHLIRLPDRFLGLADSLKVAIVDYRNDQIVHEGNIRATRGTGLRTGEGPNISVGTLYPTADEMDPTRFEGVDDPVELLRREGKESRPLPKLMAMIDDYLEAVMELIVLNRTKTPLAIDPRRP